MKKILIIAENTLGPSGVPTVILNIVRSLNSTYQFDIIVNNLTYSENEKELIGYGCTIHSMNFNLYSNSHFRNFLNFAFFYPLKLKSFVSKVLRLNDYSAIHSFQETFAYSAFKAGKKYSINKRIIHVNSAHFFTKQVIKTFGSKLSFKKLQKSFSLATNIICVSNNVLENTPFHNNKKVVLNTYNENYYNETIPFEGDSLSLCQIGTISPRKNQLFSLKVLNKIKQSNEKVKLYIGGNVIDESYKSVLEKYILDNSLASSVIFFDGSSDQKEIYKKVSVSLFPSIIESFGLIGIESQALGVHCFASKNMPEEIDCGNMTFLDLNEDIWAEEIIKYFKSKGSKRIKSNMERFSNESFKNEIESIYKL